MASLIGTWGLESQEGFDEYMKHLGVGVLLRKMGNTLKPDFIVSKDDDGVWKMLTSSTFKSTEVSFKEGVEFDETTADDRAVKATITFDGEKMIHAQTDPANAANNTVIERFVDGGKLSTVVKCGDLVATRIYFKK
jgi:hypothetical protein